MSANVMIARDVMPAIASLGANEMPSAIQFVAQFQQDPAQPGFHLHTVGHTKASGLWSARITEDLRAILHKEGDTWALLHIDHHDAAYAWAERRKVARHTDTGDLQIIALTEVEKVREKIITRAVHREALRFAHHDETYLHSLGVPPDWLTVVREARSDDDVLQICDHLDEAVAERLMDLAQGRLVTPPPPVAPSRPVTEVPDARRHFYVTGDPGELSRILNAPLDAWIAFLHPNQRGLVDRTFNGPAKVTGSAGTGKTVVAMHRARRMAQLGHKVLITSFVSTLCENIDHNLAKLCSDDERAHITVATLHKTALDLVKTTDRGVRVADDGAVQKLLETLRAQRAPDYDAAFVSAEFENVIQRQGLADWAAYRAARRTGRGRPLSMKDRKALWAVFGGVYEQLDREHRADWPTICRRAADLITSGQVASPYDAIIVDEVQDLQPMDLRFIAALASPHPENLLVVGDAGQRIYPGGFSLRALGIDVVGRSSILRLNYRTTEQIRRAADRVLDGVSDDMDGGAESRTETTSLLHGPQPTLRGHETRDDELAYVTDRVHALRASGLTLDEIAVFARSKHRFEPLIKALSASGLTSCRLAKDAAPTVSGVRIGTMHRAKGLEFKVVIVLGADAVPNPRAMAGICDPQDEEDALARERSLLYVAMTRARDDLIVTWTGAPSPFLAPLLASPSPVTA